MKRMLQAMTLAAALMLATSALADGPGPPPDGPGPPPATGWSTLLSLIHLL